MHKDLRLLNYVLTPLSNDPCRVVQINDSMIRVVHKNTFEDIPVELIMPIQVDHYWFKRMGFTKNTLDDGTIYHSLSLSNEPYCDLAFIESNKNGFTEVCLFPYDNFFRFQHVHQIQNLYFAIKKKTLIFRPKHKSNG